MSGAMGRLFVAAPLTEDLRRAVQEHLDTALGGGRLPGRVVPPCNWHLTLRFLGDTRRDMYDRLLAELRSAPLGDPFDLSFTGLGAFPRPDRARVLWLGTGDGAQALAAVAGRVEDAVVAAGFEPERRRFKAHLTLSRLRPDADVRDVIEAVPRLDAAMPVRELVVFRSHLSREGARYEVLERLALDGGPDRD